MDEREILKNRIETMHLLQALQVGNEGPGMTILRALRSKIAVSAVVEEQAKDEGLWFQAETAMEAYVQTALRRLHAIIEGKAPDKCADAGYIGAAHGFLNERDGD
jgi:hypothetical protein